MPNFFNQAIRENDLKIIESIPESISRVFYLAGGTALALQIGHRYSYDFDFFSKDEFNNLQIENQIGQIGTLQIFQAKNGTLEVSICQTRFTYLHYPYPLLEKPRRFRNLKIASILDIALMKLSALSSRGSKKDFIDLFFLQDFIDWIQIIHDFKRKYQGTVYNLYHIIKSLAYFEDALNEPMPKMIKPCDWAEVEAYFKKVQMQLAEQYL